MVTFSASSAIIPNPEQGFFQYTETHYRSDNSGYTPLDASELQTARTGTTPINSLNFVGATVVFRYFFLEKYKNADTIEPAYLALLATDLAAVRTAGCKVIIRFAYDDQHQETGPWTSDATPERVVSHIQQLAPTLNAYADIVEAIQAGFVGTWGEWFYTSNFTTGLNPNTLTANNIANRNAVINALVTNLDPRIFVLIRYPGSRQAYLGTTNPNPGGDAIRLGYHNDAFLADNGNWGTYETFSNLTITQNRTYVASTLNVPIGGEGANYTSPMGDWANASTELATYHFNFLNRNYFPQMLAAWGQSNIDTASKQLGYRFRLISATIPGTVVAGDSMDIQIVLINDGWASSFRNRPVKIVFDNGTAVSKSTLPIDMRTWVPGVQQTIDTTITAPATASSYSVYLEVVDPTISLQSTPAYSVQFANTGVWDAVHGRNSLNTTVTVNPSANTPYAISNIVKVSIGGVPTVVKIQE